ETDGIFPRLRAARLQGPLYARRNGESGHRVLNIFFPHRMSGLARLPRFNERTRASPRPGPVAAITQGSPSMSQALTVSLPAWPLGVMRRMASDARHFQIAALASLLAFNFGWIDFGAKPLNSALAIAFALATQAICSRAFGLPQIDLRSPLITGLSLSL